MEYAGQLQRSLGLSHWQWSDPGMARSGLTRAWQSSDPGMPLSHWQSSDLGMPRTMMARPSNVNRQPPQPPPSLQLRVSSAGGVPPTEYSEHQLPACVPLPLHSMHPDMQQGKDAEILSKSFDAISKLASSPAYIPAYPPPALHQPQQWGLAPPWSGGAGVQYMNPPRPVAPSPYAPTKVPLPMGTGPQHMGMNGAGSGAPRTSKAHVNAPADVDTVALCHFFILICSGANKERYASSQAAELAYSHALRNGLRSRTALLTRGATLTASIGVQNGVIPVSALSIQEKYNLMGEGYDHGEML